MSFDSNKSVRDYVSLVRGTTYKGELVGKPGPALLGLGSIQPGGGFREMDFKTYGGECPAKLMLTSGDLFASLKGATKDGKMIGSVARVPNSVVSGRLTQDTVKLQFLQPNKDSKSYLYWVLRSPQYREYGAGRAMGSAVVAMSREDFLSYEIPPLTQLRSRTVELLEEIEKRDRLLRETNATLEGIAQARFKSWFVDFDPVRAKMEGREPEGMDEATAGLFPDGFEESELGMVPKGWRVGSLADLSCLNSESWSAKNHPEIVSYVDLANAKDNEIGEVIEIEFDEAPSRARRVLRDGDTIVGTVRPGNRSFAFIQDAVSNLTGSTGFAVLTPLAVENTEFVYLSATQDSSIEHLAHVADGAAYPSVRPDVVSGLPCVVPDQSVLHAFHAVANPLLAKVARNQQQAHSLAALRDTLLPRLISGQLRVPEALEEFETA